MRCFFIFFKCLRQHFLEVGNAFCAAWVKPEPDPALPFFGAWGDNQGPILARPPGGPAVVMPADAVQGVMISNPKDRRIAELEAENERLRADVTPEGQP